MNLAPMLSAAAIVWWCAVLAVHAGSAIGALLCPALARRRNVVGEPVAVSVLAPIKDPHPGFEADFASLLEQDYPAMEVLVATTDPGSPAVSRALSLARKVPGRAVRLVPACGRGAVSPKVDTLSAAYAGASSDVLLIKDSNVRLGPEHLKAMTAQLRPGVDVVVAPPVARAPVGMAAWIETAFINTHHAKLLMAAGALGFGFGIGKLLLFRRSALERAGGLDAISHTVAEDHALAKAIGRVGGRTVMAPVSADQVLGARRFVEVWRRQHRWITCRRVEEPLAYLAEPLFGLVAASAAAALAAPAIGIDAVAAVGLTVACWLAIEAALARFAGWPLGLWSAPAAIARELMIPALWLRALAAGDVRWGADTVAARRR